MSETKALTKKDETALAAIYAEAGIEDRAGEAQEGLTQDDYAMPFLALLQSGSPQVKKTDPRKVEGASEGMYMNTVDSELFDGESGVTVIPCAYRRSFIEWKLREEGGGFVKEHPVEHGLATILDDKNRDIIKETGNELKDTRYWYVLVVREDGTSEPAVIGMTRTQIKPSRNWQNLIAKNIWPDGKQRPKAPPSYVWGYTLGVLAQQKDEYSYWVPSITRGAPVLDASLIASAMQLHDSVKAGQVREATDSIRETEAESTGADKKDGNY